MFESICIKRQDDFVGTPLDLGFLAEALLFYQQVHVVADGSILKFLLRTFGIDVLLEFLQSGLMTMTYLENGTGIRTHDQGTPLERHDFIVWEYPGYALQAVAPLALQLFTVKPVTGRRLAQKFLGLIRPVRFTEGASQEARLDLEDAEYVRTAISELLKYFVPEYELPSPVTFEVVQDKEFFRLQTNIDFPTANGYYNSRVPRHQNSLSATLLLGVLTSSREDMRSASEISADLAVPKSHSIVARCKFEEIIRKRTESKEKIGHFQDFVLTGRAVSEAVNSGSRNMADVLQLINEADKFKKWVVQQPENSELREQYCQELMRLGWADRLPAKSIRWTLFTGAATTISFLANPIVGAASGVALSASDTFLFDRLVKGWRPNQFVQGPLSDFIR